MNRKEWLNDAGRQRNKYHYKYVRQLLRNWQTENNIPADTQCVVHHRDDTEECLRYNNEHYELWGFNEDGTFEYGKYVMFMTLSEHTTYHRTGVPLSTETRKKLSIAHKGKILSDECKAKLSAVNKGRKHSEATKQKMSNSQKGKILSDECKAKIGAANKGRKLSDAARQKISESHKGKTLSDETRTKLSELHKGKKLSNEAKSKLSEWHKGKKLSDETKAKLREINKQRMAIIAELYTKHKNNGGKLSWNEFRKSLKEIANDGTNDIT